MASTMNSTTRIGPLLALAFIALAGVARAGAQNALELNLTLGDYRFKPDRLEAVAGTPVRLTLTNTDAMTPHNFTLEALRAGVDLSTDVKAGKSITVEFTPKVPGTYPFFCNKKLLFFKSHREQGMEGKLVVRGAP